MRLGDSVSVFVLYPLVPWIGVMAAGYALGPVMQLEPAARQRLLFGLGAALTLGFVLLRASNVYGDPAPWSAQATLAGDGAVVPQLREISAVAALSADDARPGADAARRLRACARPAACVLAIFGQVPFFFYVVHIYLIHALAVTAAWP